MPKVRIAIQGLSFTTEGYERARNMLKTRYGKPSEIVNSYVQNIMPLPRSGEMSSIHGNGTQLVKRRGDNNNTTKLNIIVEYNNT